MNFNGFEGIKLFIFYFYFHHFASNSKMHFIEHPMIIFKKSVQGYEKGFDNYYTK